VVTIRLTAAAGGAEVSAWVRYHSKKRLGKDVWAGLNRPPGASWPRCGRVCRPRRRAHRWWCRRGRCATTNSSQCGWVQQRWAQHRKTRCARQKEAMTRGQQQRWMPATPMVVPLTGHPKAA
jgi:hypothetical protein